MFRINNWAKFTNKRSEIMADSMVRYPHPWKQTRCETKL